MRSHGPTLAPNPGDKAEERIPHHTKPSESVSPVTPSHTGPQVVEGLKFVKMDGDGDCLFHAVGHHLGKGAFALRNEVAQLMEDEKDYYQSFYTPGEQDGMSFDEYIQAIRNEKLYGGEREIRIMERLYQRPLVIFFGNGLVTFEVAA